MKRLNGYLIEIGFVMIMMIFYFMITWLISL